MIFKLTFFSKLKEYVEGYQVNSPRLLGSWQRALGKVLLL